MTNIFISAIGSKSELVVCRLIGAAYGSPAAAPPAAPAGSGAPGFAARLDMGKKEEVTLEGWKCQSGLLKKGLSSEDVD